MLFQYLVQNPVITVEQDNQLQIEWPKAAPLVNYNFYYTIRRVDESEHFRYNQYPYTQQGVSEGSEGSEGGEVPLIDPEATGEELERQKQEVLLYLSSWNLHYYLNVTDETLYTFQVMFPDDITLLVTGSRIVRSSIDYPITDVASLGDSFFVASPSLLKYIYSPNGWYEEYAAQKLDTIMRQPLWGADQPIHIDISKFNDNGWYVIGNGEAGDTAGFLPEVITDLNNPHPSPATELKYLLDSNQALQPLLFAETRESNYPLFKTPSLQSVDRVWGRVHTNDGLCVVNVPVTIRRKLKNGLYYYTIIIDATIYPRTNAYLELY